MIKPVLSLASFILPCVLRGGSFSVTPTVSEKLIEVHLCLRNAIMIRNELAQQHCPYNMLEEGVNCTIFCSGKVLNNNSLYDIDDRKTCVNFTLDLHTNPNLREKVPPTVQEEYCNISKCIIEWISITCTFPKRIDLLLALSCGVVGCILGVVFILSGRKFKQTLLRASPMPFNQDQPAFGESIDNLHMYSDIEDTARLSEKGTQVPSFKDKSPSSMRSRTSNVHHLLSEKGSPVDSICSIKGTISRQGSISGDSIHDGNLRESNSSTNTNVMEQKFETRSEDSNKYFQLELKPEDP